ncbi:MAG TPA: histidine phosphatase family protein [Candidatus Saccharimonadales bacterium]|nr:histidine phosphatase family protein [Candidatus Saccharimonadales bacterium]
MKRDDYDPWPLLAEGVQQAELLRREVGQFAIDACLCSPTLRTRQTADIVLGERQIEVEYMEELRERDRGIFAYMPDEWSDNHPLYRIGKESFRKWHPGGEGMQPRAETIEEVIARIDSAVLRRADALAPGGCVAISTHGETMAAFRGVRRLGARDDARYAMPVIPNHKDIKPHKKASWIGQVQIDIYERRADGPEMTHFRTLGYHKGERFGTDWIEIVRD